MSLQPRFKGALSQLTAFDRTVLLDRARGEIDTAIAARVRAILERVRTEGDSALFDITQDIDGIRLERLEVAQPLVRDALDKLPAELRKALERAARNVETVHHAFMPGVIEIESEPGVMVGRRPDALDAVGVYAPGGRATYPSSVLMGVIPARVAGVRQVFVCSPPTETGLPSQVVLAAAAIAGATRVFALGGAQAIAALAFGSESVLRVDRIVGPGNAYVAEAKRQVAGLVGIDAPAGPSEILIIADDSADPEHIVRELVAQAEHDPEASCIALTTSPALAAQVLEQLASWQPEDPGFKKLDVVQTALASRGAVLSVSNLEEALAFADAFGAEHLLLAVRDPEASFEKVRHAGTVFWGGGASVSFGDYLTGANHVLPTAGANRAFSGLSTSDFMRWTSYQRVDRSAAARMSADVGSIADAEGLATHAAAARAFEAAVSSGPRPLPTPRASYRRMKLYTSNREPAPVDLSDNTNQRGAPPSALQLIDPGQSDALFRYPSHYADELKRAIGKRIGVAADHIVTGCGSDDVLDSAIRAFSTPGDRLAFPDPTFAMMPFLAHMNGLEAHAVPLKGAADGYDIDAEALLAARASIIYVCSPNNPTGTLASRRSIERLLREASGLVILDEAYIEYASAADSFVAWAGTARWPGARRLLVVRTLSKAYGLAGARVGYAIGAPELVLEVEKSRGPYKVSRLAERMAAAVLDNDVPWVEEGIAEVRDARARFEAWLGEKSVGFLPSSSNFVLVPVADAADAAARLRAHGVAVRPLPKLTGLGDCIRISVGSWPVMERILAPLSEVLKCA